MLLYFHCIYNENTNIFCIFVVITMKLQNIVCKLCVFVSCIQPTVCINIVFPIVNTSRDL